MSSELDYRAIRKRVEAGIAQQKHRIRLGSFYATLVVFILLTILGVGLYPRFGLLGVLILVLSSFLGLIFQGIALAQDTKYAEDQIREQLTAREINREMFKMGMDDREEYEKRKRMVRLTDDGELEDVGDERLADDPPAMKPLSGE